MPSIDNDNANFISANCEKKNVRVYVEEGKGKERRIITTSFLFIPAKFFRRQVGVTELKTHFSPICVHYDDDTCMYITFFAGNKFVHVVAHRRKEIL